MRKKCDTQKAKQAVDHIFGLNGALSCHNIFSRYVSNYELSHKILADS